HFPVAVETTRGVDRDRQRIDVTAHAPAVAEKISHWHFNRRHRFIIPVHAQYQASVILLVYGEPDMLNNARTINVGKRDHLVAFNVNAGGNFPSLPELTRDDLAGAFGGFPGFSFCACEIFS